MYIYLDETFNLKKGTKNQFLAIAGFATDNPKRISGLFDRIKKIKLPKRISNNEIKSTDRLANMLIKPYLFPALVEEKINIYCNLQAKSFLPTKYYYKGKLNYDQFYLDLLTDLLLKRWHYLDQKVIIVTLDTFKTKRIDKSQITEKLINGLTQKYPDKTFQITFEGSASSLNLQLADFICSIFSDYLWGNDRWFKLLEKRIKIIKNPLN